MFIFLAFAAGVVRGYSGFGFAMMLTLGLLLSRSAAQVVPVVLLLDLVCSISLWPGALKTFHPGVGMRLIIGMLLAVPLGALALARLPEQWMAPVAAGVCLLGGVLVLIGPVAVEGQRVLPTFWALPAGLASGLATAMASAGGPPLVVYLLRSGLSAACVRGTAIVFFAVSSACALVTLALLQAMTGEQLSLAVSLLLPALAGNVLGQWLFRRKPLSLQRLIGGLLVLLSAATLLGSLTH
jgi:uncharacterized membrane protein YfcA